MPLLPPEKSQGKAVLPFCSEKSAGPEKGIYSGTVLYNKGRIQGAEEEAEFPGW